MLNFEKLIAPERDGDVLIEPPASQWEQLLQDNIRKRNTSSSKPIVLTGIAVEDVRQQVRQALSINGATEPIIACGHQPAFIHPGVWAKQVAVRHAADRLGISAFDLVVDHDAPRSSALTVPILQSDGLLKTEQIEFWPAPAGSAYEGRPVLTPINLKRIKVQLGPVLKSTLAEAAIPAYLNGLAAASEPRGSVDQHLSGRRHLDCTLKADLPTIRVSRAFGGHFLADLLLNAGRFAQAYNDALSNYRQHEKVKEPDRPLPDLQRATDRIETALWIYQPLTRRRRLWLERAGNRIQMYADDAHIGEVNAEQLTRDPTATLNELHPWVIRPRALTLTLWARLLACDLFVHGIGGAKYDRITDNIFRRYYNCEPPAMACVTATLRLPLPRHEVTTMDLKRAQNEWRDLQYNPQRYLASPSPTLLKKREQLVEQSNQQRAEHADTNIRRDTFRQLRDIKAQLAASEPQVAIQLAQRVHLHRQKLNSNQIADSREFFYALQPPQRLQMLANRLSP